MCKNILELDENPQNKQINMNSENNLTLTFLRKLERISVITDQRDRRQNFTTKQLHSTFGNYYFLSLIPIFKSFVMITFYVSLQSQILCQSPDLRPKLF